MSAYRFVLHHGGWHFGGQLAAHDPLYLQATTACLSAIIVMQIANVFLCRSDRRSSFAFGPFSNKLIVAGIGAEIALILLIDYTPWGNALFGTAPIPLVAWLFITPFALGMLGLEELRKWFVRSRCSAVRSP
jgi:magnesium-transporting ATPase (P-type)